MSLSPLAIPFLSCPSLSNVLKRDEFFSKAYASLSSFDFHLFSDILLEWESCTLLDHCFSFWKRFIPARNNLQINSLHILSFNVRGFCLLKLLIGLLVGIFIGKFFLYSLNIHSLFGKEDGI